MTATELKGHSGCRIFLCESEKGVQFVRKISSDADYNKRLKAQCDKQALFKKAGASVPEIYQTGFTDEGLFFFEMEYIRGIALSRYMKTISVSDIRYIVESILENTSIEKDGPVNGAALETNTIFLKKILGIEALIKSGPPVREKGLDLLKNHDWSKMTGGMGHGDLTFENIIIRGDQLYYIDFLDSFYDSRILDYGKLFQDAQAMWSYRYETIDINTQIRLLIFRDILTEKISRKDPGLLREVNYALLLHLMRIYPYTWEERTAAFLDCKIERTIRTIDQMTG